MNSSLIQCPACSKQVSAQAVSCIQCGHPFSSSVINMNAVFGVLGIGCLLILGLGLYKVNPEIGDLAATAFEARGAEPEKNTASLMELDNLPGKLKGAFITANASADLSYIAEKMHRNARPYWNQHYKVDRIYFSPDQRLLRISYWVKADITEGDIPVGVFASSYCNDSAYQIFRDYGVMGHIVFKNENAEVASRTVDPNACT